MTGAEQRLLQTMSAEQEKVGWPMTFGRIMELYGASRAPTHQRLHALIDKGLVEQSPYTFGGFRVRTKVVTGG